MRLALLGLFIFIVSTVSAQRACVSTQYFQFISTDAAVANSMRAAEMNSQRSGISGAAAQLSSNTIIQIPVVVHVVYNTAAQNISDAQIKSQIDALNRDFRRRNADTTNTPTRFKSVAADVQIEFVLATADAAGRATNGIVRRQTSVSYWQMDDKIKFTAQGGSDAWDSRYYLNIWVGNTKTLLGYASYIGGPAEKDGIVINTTAFGTFNVSAPYDKGRTLVHETGHWLGLKHIWGDTYCGDDGVDDTPKQGGFTSGCPTDFRSSCSNGALGDMYMNFMDFTNDACLNLFTKGQAARMRSLFNEGAARYSILFSKGLQQPWMEETPLTDGKPATDVSGKMNIFPNPSHNEINLDLAGDLGWIGKKVRIVNLNGTTMQEIILTAKTQNISINNLKPGIYFLQGQNGAKRLMVKLVKL